MSQPWSWAISPSAAEPPVRESISALKRSKVTSTVWSVAATGVCRTGPSAAGLLAPRRSCSAYRGKQSTSVRERTACSAQQLRQPPVGQRLAAGLTRRAVLQRGVREADLADRVTAHRAGQAGAGVHLQARALLALQRRRLLP